MSLAVMACDECIHSDVCFGKALHRQFAEEIVEVMGKYVDKTRESLTTSYEEWFGVYVNCKHFQKEGEHE